MSQELDTVLAGLAISLEQGKIGIEDAIQSMQQQRVFERADGENVKILLRLAFMSSCMQSCASAYWIAMVAYLVSRNLKKPDIHYGLDMGIGNAVACSLFAVTTILSLMEERDPDLLPLFAEMLEALKEDEDTRGYLETLLQLADAEFRLKRYADAARHYQESLATIGSLSNANQTLSRRSSQDLVRFDNQNVFDFGMPPLGEPVNVPALRVILNDYAAKCLAETKDYKEALAFSSEAVAIWESKQLAPGYNPETIASVLHSHATLLVFLHELRKAIPAATACLDQAKLAGNQMIELGAAYILAYCYQELGDKSAEEKYRAMVVSLNDKLQLGNQS